MFAVALVNALLYWFFSGNIGYTLLNAFTQPLFFGLVNGVIFGNVAQGVIIGAAITMIYVGMIAPGANMPADAVMAGAVAIPVAMSSGMPTDMAMALAVPFSILGVFIHTLRRVLDANWQHMADKYAQEGNIPGISRLFWCVEWIQNFILRVPLVFVAIYFGSSAAEALDKIPEWILHGITVAGGMLPAMGFALVIFIIGTNTLLPFFFMGFFAVKYFNLNTVGSAIFGLLICLVLVMMKRQNNAMIMGKVRDMVEGED